MDKPTVATWIELRVLRQKDGHSLSSLARTAEMSLGYLSDLEAGKRKPNPGVIKRLATALNVPMSVLEPRRPEDARSA
jgi:transcriptional regulator with XRE-family HTH domain